MRDRQEMSKSESQPLPFLVKGGYGAASGALGMMFSLVSLYVLFFLTDVARLDPAFAGFVVMLGTLWDACLNPMVGMGSDRLNTRWGRRRPFLLVAAVPYGVIGWLLFSDFSLGPTTAKLYFSVMIILYFTANACLEVPYSSLGAEMSQDYDERTSLMGFRMAWSQIASIAGAALPLPVAMYFAGVLGSQRAGWSAMAGAFGLVCIPMILVTWRTTRGYEVFSQATQPNPLQALRDTFRNRPFRYAVGVWTFGGVAMAISGYMIVYFLTYVLGLNDTWSSLAFLILFACGVLWIPVVNLTSARLGKRWTYIIYVGAWGLVQALAVPFGTPETWWVFFVAMFLASAGVVTLFISGYAMIADVVEVDEFKSGHRREGFYFGTAFLVQKLLAAFAVWGIGITLSRVGYVPDAPQTETALAGIRTLYAWGSGAAFLISIVFCYLVPITRDNHTALLEAMRLKKEGKPYDIEAIKDIVL